MNPNEHLSPGLSYEKTFMVEDKHTALHLGSGMMKVLATPSMIQFMEITARIMLDKQLPEGYSSVGTIVNVRHLAATGVGREVLTKVRLTAVDSNKLMMDVAVWDGETLLGNGEHGRYVIEVARFLKQIEEK